MKLWFGLPLLLAIACSSNETTNPSASGKATKPSSTGSVVRAKDTGGGLDTIETAQRRIEKAPAMNASASAGQSGGMSAASGASKRAANSSKKPSAAPEPKQEEARAQAPEATGDDAGMMMTPMQRAPSTPNTPTMPMTNAGSCCVASDRPGCRTLETQACVCALQPDCCNKAWNETCVFIVSQKFCQASVRACVCGSGPGQWQQAECCARSWTDTCDSVATNKCGAKRGCF